VIVFAAGEQRWIDRTSRLGLHGTSSPLETHFELRRSRRAIVDYLAGRGVDRAFAERGLAVDPEDMWYPSREEILAARLATGLASLADVALSGLDDEEIQRLPLTFRTIPFYQALFEFERPVFDRLLAALQDGYRRGTAGTEAFAPLDDDIGPLVERLLPRASDQAARSFYAESAAVLHFAAKRDPAACAEGLAAGDLELAAELGSDLEGGMQQALADVIQSAHLEPGAPARLEDVEEVLEVVHERVESRSPGASELISSLEVAAKDRPAEVCRAFAIFAEEVGKLAPEEAGPLVRALAASEEDGEPEGTDATSL
jgi:hypothetical protein